MLHNFSGKKNEHYWSDKNFMTGIAVHPVCDCWVMCCVSILSAGSRHFCGHLLFRCPGFPPALEQRGEGSVQDDLRLLQQKSLDCVFGLRSS